jgi:hypothetical protein
MATELKRVKSLSLTMQHAHNLIKLNVMEWVG